MRRTFAEGSIVTMTIEGADGVGVVEWIDSDLQYAQVRFLTPLPYAFGASHPINLAGLKIMRACSD